ncbi:MAG: hypothetical protein M3460_15375 [Actinomycetota bacterium]|nr:hypothetical protein [Actinomycetota bacterium]
MRNVARVTRVRVSSIRRGPLSGTVVDGIGLRVALPLADVDVLLLEPR